MNTKLAQVAKILLGLWMAGVVIAMFLIVPPHIGLGYAGRIIIMHVPTAWVTSLAFLLSAIYSVRYLRGRRISDDAGAVAAAEVGFLFCVLATVTGAIFAQIVWGVFWNWDPRETSILVLLLFYAAYFGLRAQLDEPERRRRVSAAYNIFAGVTMPFLLFVVPRMAENTLHPNCAFLSGSKCDGITLQLNGTKIGVLGDTVLELQGLEQQGNELVAKVQVRTPGLTDVQVLEPRFDLSNNTPSLTPEFPEQRFVLRLDRADPDTGTVHLNMEAPGTGLLSNPSTFWTFQAGIVGFTGLFLWLYRLRTTMLVLEERLATRRRGYA